MLAQCYIRLRIFCVRLSFSGTLTTNSTECMQSIQVHFFCMLSTLDSLHGETYWMNSSPDWRTQNTILTKSSGHGIYTIKSIKSLTSNCTKPVAATTSVRTLHRVKTCKQTATFNRAQRELASNWQRWHWLDPFQGRKECGAGGWYQAPGGQNLVAGNAARCTAVISYYY